MIYGFGFDYKLNLIYVKYELTIMINEPNLSFNQKTISTLIVTLCVFMFFFCFINYFLSANESKQETILTYDDTGISSHTSHTVCNCSDTSTKLNQTLVSVTMDVKILLVYCHYKNY